MFVCLLGFAFYAAGKHESTNDRCVTEGKLKIKTVYGMATHEFSVM